MLDRWYGVTCDECHSSSEILETARLARAAAKRRGWMRVAGEQYRGHQKGRDLCPKCAKG